MMKYLDTIRNFELKLQRNPQLMQSTINAYIQIIRELINKYSIDPSVEQLNEFIAYKSKKRIPIAKYAIKHYLSFRWRNNIYYQLVKPRIRKASVKKNFLSKEEAKTIINAIKKSDHRLIAKIQYLTGARASEVISIKKSNIHVERKYKRLRIDIVGKGDKIDPIYLDEGYYYEINQYILKKGNYLFFDIFFDELTEKQKMTKMESLYKRYYESLKNAAMETNLNISTHDWRRSFAQSLKEDGVDILDIKKALRHESIETTEKYFKDDPENIAKTMLKHQQAI